MAQSKVPPSAREKDIQHTPFSISLAPIIASVASDTEFQIRI